jgi:hypothetical protein
MAAINPRQRAVLEEARAADAAPRPKGSGLAVYVGNPPIKLRDANGYLTPAGHAWMRMGGPTPRRFGAAAQDPIVPAAAATSTSRTTAAGTSCAPGTRRTTWPGSRGPGAPTASTSSSGST